MTVRYRKTRWTFAAAVAVAALALAGCSSSGGSGGTSSGTASGTTSGTASTSSQASCKAAPTGTPLKVGVIDDATGPSAAQGQTEVPTVLTQWKKYITCNGGIGGHPVDFTYIDDKSNPALSVQAAKTLISDHVIAIMDNTTLNTTWAKFVDAAGIPVLDLTGSINNALYVTDSNFYASENAGQPYGTYGIVKAASLGGGKKFGVLYCSEFPGCALLPKLMGPYATQLGMTMVYSAGFSASQPNYTALCLAAKAKGVDAFSPVGVPAAMLEVYTQCGSQGYHPTATFIGQGLGADFSSYDQQVPEIYGAVGTIPWFVKNAATKPFYDYMQSYIDSSGFKATNATPSGLIADWTGLQMLAAAGAHVSATPTSADIKAGLLSFNGNTLGGLTSPLTFTAGHLRGNCEFYFGIIKGKMTLPYGLKPQCDPKLTLPTG